MGVLERGGECHSKGGGGMGVGVCQREDMIIVRGDVIGWLIANMYLREEAQYGHQAVPHPTMYRRSPAGG